MQATCSHCGARFTLSNAQIGNHPRVQFRCAQCGKNTVVKTVQADSTQVVFVPPGLARSGALGDASAALDAHSKDLSLPNGKNIAVSVLSGPAKGLVYSLEKPRVVIGRKSADILINDPNISRWHCVVEVEGDIVRVRDLDSTNGTFMGSERVGIAELRHLSEFRVGESVLLVTITSRLAVTR
jgi:predicted Zn finger-like uncharacterized protein